MVRFQVDVNFRGRYGRGGRVEATAVISRQELVGPGHKAPGGQSLGQARWFTRQTYQHSDQPHPTRAQASQHQPAAGRSQASEGRDPGPPAQWPPPLLGLLVLCLGSPPLPQHAGKFLRKYTSPCFPPSSESSPVNIFREQRLGAFISGPRAT